MAKIIWREVEGEMVAMKKDFLGWRVVAPVKDMDGKKNWLNILFGGKRGLFITIILLIIVVGLYFGIQELIHNYKVIADSPCTYCKTCQNYVTQTLNKLDSTNYKMPEVNFSNLK